MSIHKLTHLTDPDGREVVGVSMSNRPQAKAFLYREDYDRIVAKYPPAQWLLIGNGKGKSYVRFYVPGKPRRIVPVAREVAGDYDRTNVCFNDGDTLNLRRSNLSFTAGGGRVKKRRRSLLSSLHIPLGKAT